MTGPQPRFENADSSGLLEQVSEEMDVAMRELPWQSLQMPQLGKGKPELAAGTKAVMWCDVEVWWSIHASALLPEVNMYARESGLSAKLQSTW